MLCSYYADFVSWTEGCSRRGLGQGGLRLTRRRWIDPTPVLDHEVSQAGRLYLNVSPCISALLALAAGARYISPKLGVGLASSDRLGFK